MYRRGDIEVLFYNLIEWLGGKLPWEDIIEKVKPPEIHKAKIRAFKDPEAFLTSCFQSSGLGAVPEFLKKVMESVEKLKFEEAPDYQNLRSIFNHEIYRAKVGQTEDKEVRYVMKMIDDEQLINLVQLVTNLCLFCIGRLIYVSPFPGPYDFNFPTYPETGKYLIKS